jgi:hypothetical protein
MRAMVVEGKVAAAHAARSNEAGAAGRLFPGSTRSRAAMDDLLDVRRQLVQPLTRLRAALSTRDRAVRASAWDEGYAREVEDRYRQQVVPALLDVQQALDEVGAVPTLLRLASTSAS